MVTPRGGLLPSFTGNRPTFAEMAKTRAGRLANLGLFVAVRRVEMRSPRSKAAIIDLIAGVVLIAAGLAGALAHTRFGESLPRPPAIDHWWPLLLIFAGVVMWLTESRQVRR